MYHPGQGVYRSAAKNAERLARTEVNMAYREAEYLRWQQLDFVVGFRVMLSNNHTTKDSKGKTVPLTDICDELAGDYPKTFKFLGWHPQCRCVVVPIMSDYDEFNKDRANRLKAIIRGQTYKSLPSRRTVRDVPAAFRSHIEAIADRSKNWKAMPYYIRDNFKNGVISGGLLPSIPQKAQMPGTTAKPPQPCTEFDGEIANFKTWAYTYGLDVAALDVLRTSGDREGLRAELKRLQGELLPRRADWIHARSEVEDFAKTAIGYDDVISEIDKELNATKINTSNYYGDCISRLKAFFASLPAKLAAAKAKKGSYSANMPAELEKGKAYLGDADHEFSKDFFDLLKRKVKLEIHNSTGRSYESGGNLVVVYTKGRNEVSPWHRVSVIYHEFGHAIADQRNLLFAKEVTDLRDAQTKRLRTREKTTYYTTERVWNYKTGKYEVQKVKHEVNQMRIITLSAKIKNIYERIRTKDKDDPIFKRYGISKPDALEQFGGLMDTLRSLVNRDDVGWGHSVSYFKSYGMKQHEYLAHAFENAFIGNRVFQLLMPTEYAEMVALAKSFKTP